MNERKAEIYKESENVQESILNKPKLQEFIRDRSIQPEDFHLIEEMAAFPRRLIIQELHNMFNSNKDSAGHELKSEIAFAERSGNDEAKRLCEVALAFFNKYSWPASWNLVRILEGEYD